MFLCNVSERLDLVGNVNLFKLLSKVWWFSVLCIATVGNVCNLFYLAHLDDIMWNYCMTSHITTCIPSVLILVMVRFIERS